MREKLVYVATSIYAKDKVWPYDPLGTVDIATKHGFSGVQLFPDKRYTPDVIEELRGRISRHNLGVLIHLPNNPSKDDLLKARSLGEGMKGCQALVHHDGNLVVNRQSVGGGISLGIENSANRFDVGGVEKAWGMAGSLGTFFVFDPMRLYNADNQGRYPTKDEADLYIRRVLRRLRPGDIIHFSDKTTIDRPFRACQCIVGQGIARSILEQVRRLSNIVVLEHEEIDLAVDSLPVLRNQA